MGSGYYSQTVSEKGHMAGKMDDLLKEWESSNSNRHYEVRLSRLFIRHIQMTHEYLMTKELPPICHYCPKLPLMIEYYLIGCPKWVAERQNLKLYETLGEILRNDCDVMKLMKSFKKVKV